MGCLGPVGVAVLLAGAFAAFATAWLAAPTSPVEREWRRLSALPTTDARVLDVRPSKPELIADGADSLVVTVALRDAAGTLVRSASGPVKIRASDGSLASAVAELRDGVARVGLTSPLVYGGNPVVRRTLRLAHRILAASREQGSGPLAHEPSARIAIVAEGLGLRGGASLRLIAPAPPDIPRRGRFHGHGVEGSGEWLLDLVPRGDGFVARMRRTDRTGGLLVATWTGHTVLGHALVQVAEDADLAALEAAGLGFRGFPSLVRPLPGGGLALLGPPIDFLPAAAIPPARLRLSLVAEKTVLNGEARASTRLILRVEAASGQPVEGAVARWRLLSPPGLVTFFDEQATTGADGTAVASLRAEPCGSSRVPGRVVAAAEVGEGPDSEHAQAEITRACAPPP